mgnify:FL=1
MAEDGINPKILLMDDEDVIRENMEEIGELLDIEIVTTKNANETIDRFSSAFRSGVKFDAVILDLTIKGGIGGCETLRELRQIDPAIKSILFSGDEYSHVSQNYRDYGFTDVIKKPVNIQEFEAKIRELFS